MPLDLSMPALLRQTEWWQPAKGGPVKLTEMSCRYKANTHAFLLRNSANIERRYRFRIAMDFATYADELGVYSITDPSTPEGHEAFVERVGALQWLRETPLLRELLYQSRASAFDGPIA